MFDEVPTGITPIRAWRVWKLLLDDPGPGDRLVLSSVSNDYKWWSDVPRTHARCKLYYNHIAPEETCRCGLYAGKSVTDLPPGLIDSIDRPVDWHLSDPKREPIILGVVDLWGRVIEGYNKEGDGGYRAEFARPVAFCPTQYAEAPHVRNTMDRLAKEWRVPLVPTEIPASMTARFEVRAEAIQARYDAAMEEVTKMCETSAERVERLSREIQATHWALGKLNNAFRNPTIGNVS